MVDVVLINPPYVVNDRYIDKKLYSPRNLTCLSAVLLEHNYTVEIIDMPALKMSEERLLQEIKSQNPSLVGVPCHATSSFHVVRRISSLVKKEIPESILITGGVYPTFLPEKVLQDAPAIDLVVVGEGEYTTLDIASACLNNKPLDNIKGIALRINGQIKTTSERTLMKDLDALPFPATHLLPLERYMQVSDRYYVLETSRGCPYQCTFCAAMPRKIRNIIRYREITNCVEEMEIASEKFEFKKFLICDNTFAVNKRKAEEFCDEITKRRLDISWRCQTRVDSVNPALLSKMKKSGCKLVSYGVETLSPSTLTDVRKRITPTTVESAIEMTKRAGIKAQINLIVGFPGEKWEDIMSTIKHVRKLKPDGFLSFAFVPLPGTPYYNNPRKFGLKIMEQDLSNFTIIGPPIIETEELSQVEIAQLLLYAHYVFSSKENDETKGPQPRRRSKTILIKTQNGGVACNLLKSDLHGLHL